MYVCTYYAHDSMLHCIVPTTYVSQVKVCKCSNTYITLSLSSMHRLQMIGPRNFRNLGSTGCISLKLSRARPSTLLKWTVPKNSKVSSQALCNPLKVGTCSNPISVHAYVRMLLIVRKYMIV